MRFLADGPSIPDELLLARDQGRVVFFCGAGVSRARANLPDFFGLAERVNAKLGVLPESPANKLVQEARDFDIRVGIAGIISADRVFGLLEREFSARDIESAVASALKPSEDCDTSAHKVLVDLATTSDGLIRLVTTNFDRLFDNCAKAVHSWQPPRLPDPSRAKEMDGIIYLHGKATTLYDGAEGDGFVLSSSEFGRAYLSDGWATSFIREVLERYIVVFVGYTADDPPVYYLLEALNKSSSRREKIYAFQSGDHDDAVARWRHKGVEAIPYSPENAHAALWQTLEAWAERARAPDAWQARIIELARKGPTELRPHERGQIAHIVSTYEGAKAFSTGERAPPADWLCVFDRYRRFAKPGHVGSYPNQGPYVDPFDLYGLDSDVPPTPIASGNHNAKREVPKDAWDVFDLNRLDRASLHDGHFSSLRGYWASRPARMVPRIAQIGIWILQVCDQPAALWWAARQSALHSDLQEWIENELGRNNRTIHPDIWAAWRRIFEATKHQRSDFHRDIFEFAVVANKCGWSRDLVRAFGEIFRPALSVEPDFWGGPRPPDALEDGGLGRVFRLDVKYPEIDEKIEVPDEWLPSVVSSLRYNLEIAVDIEMDIGGYGLNRIAPIIPDNDPNEDRYERFHGLSSFVLYFTSLFEKLANIDSKAARRELGAWKSGDGTIFDRLLIWASGIQAAATAQEFRKIITSIDRETFWRSQHQRDLLLSISARWGELDSKSRKAIERKLLGGPKRWKREKRGEYEERKAWDIVNRIQWLSNAGCEFSFPLEGTIADLAARSPRWKPEYGAKAAEANVPRGGWVRTETDYAALLNIPLLLVLEKAEELSGRGHFLVENDPFAGLSSARPVRALAALAMAAKQGNCPEWAWRRFLNADSRKSDRPKLVGLIAERLMRLSDDQLSLIIRPSADWLYAVSGILSKEYTSMFDRVFQKISLILKTNPECGSSGILRSDDEPDWTMESINSPTGKVAEALFSDHRISDISQEEGLPGDWLQLVESLLLLPDAIQRHALVILCYQTNWLYYYNPYWVDKNLIPKFKSEKEDERDAAWAGFLWRAHTPSRDLYLKLKPQLLSLVLTPLSACRSYEEIVAGMVLAGWGSVDEETNERCVSDDEMRTLLVNADDAFRSRVLWQAQRWSDEVNEKSHERWTDELPALLRIWPRQIAAKSPTISARLCELAFASGDDFPKIVDLVLPLLTKIERDHIVLPELRRSGSGIIDRYPERALALLHAALPDSAASWPYGIEGTLLRIGEVEPSLHSDERLIELKRKWDAR